MRHHFYNLFTIIASYTNDHLLPEPAPSAQPPGASAIENSVPWTSAWLPLGSFTSFTLALCPAERNLRAPLLTGVSQPILFSSNYIIVWRNFSFQVAVGSSPFCAIAGTMVGVRCSRHHRNKAGAHAGWGACLPREAEMVQGCP